MRARPSPRSPARTTKRGIHGRKERRALLAASWGQTRALTLLTARAPARPRAPLTLAVVVQGFFITLDKIGWWWRWLHWVRFHSYSFASFMTNEFEGASFACTQSSTLSFCEPGQESVPGDDVLTLYDIGAGVPGRDIWGNSGVLIAMTVLYRLIAAAWQWWFHVGKK